MLENKQTPSLRYLLSGIAEDAREHFYTESLNDLAALEEEMGRHFLLGLPVGDSETIKADRARWEFHMQRNWGVSIRYLFAPENNYDLRVEWRPIEELPDGEPSS